MSMNCWVELLQPPVLQTPLSRCRSLFVEKLDFNPDQRHDPSRSIRRCRARPTASPPAKASRLLPPSFPHADRLRTRDLRNTLKALGQTLTGEIVLAATDAGALADRSCVSGHP